jgi:hypothetical protein
MCISSKITKGSAHIVLYLRSDASPSGRLPGLLSLLQQPIHGVNDYYSLAE